MKQDERITGRALKSANVSAIVTGLRLLYYRDALLAQILNRAIGAAPVNGEYLIETVSREFGNVFLAASQFIPDQQTEANTWFTLQ
jgi:hypothetical protein